MQGTVTTESFVPMAEGRKSSFSWWLGSEAVGRDPQ